MSEIDEAGRYLTAGLQRAIQTAASFAAVTQGGREWRDTSAFLAGQQHADERHQADMELMNARLGWALEEHDLDVAHKKDLNTNANAKADRESLLDIARGIEIGARVVRNTATDKARQDEINARIENAKKDLERRDRVSAETRDRLDRESGEEKERRDKKHDRSMDGYDDRARWGEEKHRAQMDEINARIENAKKDLERRDRVSTETRDRLDRESGEENERKNQKHEKSIEGYNDRAEWGAAEHRAKMAEIYQRVRDRARRQGFTATLSEDKQRDFEANLRSIFAAAASTADPENSALQAFMDRAREDGVDLDAIIAAAAQGRSLGDDPAEPAPEDQLVENLVQQTRDHGPTTTGGDAGPDNRAGTQPDNTVRAADLNSTNTPQPGADTGPAAHDVTDASSPGTGPGP